MQFREEFVNLHYIHKIFSKEKREKECNLQLDIGNGIAINPEGWQVEERDLSLCALLLPMFNTLVEKTVKLTTTFQSKLTTCFGSN